MTIEHANLDTLEDLVKLNTTIFEPLYPWPPFTLAEYQQKLKDKQSYILIAKEKDVLAADSISFPKNDCWYIWILGVAPEYRRRGIATKLFEMNEAEAKKLGYKKVQIKIYDVSKEMLLLAEKRGYELVETMKTQSPTSTAFIVELHL